MAFGSSDKMSDRDILHVSILSWQVRNEARSLLSRMLICLFGSQVNRRLLPGKVAMYCHPMPPVHQLLEVPLQVGGVLLLGRSRIEEPDLDP